MDDLVSMGTILRNLEKPLGFAGAVNQLLQALRSGKLTGVCDQFHGLNASNRPIYELPNEAENFPLPVEFWGYAQWQKDGETSVQTTNQPFDPWTFNADWRNGHFSVTGSYHRGKLPVVRMATGVRLSKGEAAAFLKMRGIRPSTSPNRTLDHDAIRQRATDLRIAQSGISKGSTAASIIAELGPSPRTGNNFDQRHIERLIAPLWAGDSEQPPPLDRIPPVCNAPSVD